MVSMKEFFEKVDFEKNQQMKKKHTKLPSMQRVDTTGGEFSPLRADSKSKVVKPFEVRNLKMYVN